MEVIIEGKLQPLLVEPDMDIVRRLFRLPIQQLALMDYCVRSQVATVEGVVTHMQAGAEPTKDPDGYYRMVLLLRDITKLHKEIQHAIREQP